jgi:tRNA1Val (adenine37-N6)-methyltransferase
MNRLLQAPIETSAMTAEGGIVRAARRPRGWQAPGPAPAAGADPTLGPHAGEDLCYLAGDWRILQQVAGHRWSLDDLVTAWVATRVVAANPPVRFVDLGCGIGTVLMLTAWSFPDATGIGIEAQAASVDLARRSLAWNGADTRCGVRLGDFRDHAPTSDVGAVDLVTGTPPYLTPGHATASHRAQCGPCHFEERGGVEDYTATAASLLAPGGRFVMCAAAFQHDRVLTSARATGLEVEARVDVVPREGKTRLFAVYAMRHADDPPNATSALPRELVVRDRAGRWTPAFAEVRTAMGMPAA